jgi:hypothetical protein
MNASNEIGPSSEFVSWNKPYSKSSSLFKPCDESG